MPTKKPNSSNRYRLSVPEADVLVNNWIAEQNNLSFSLRLVIKDAIRRYGMIDITCSDSAEVVPPLENNIPVSSQLPVNEPIVSDSSVPKQNPVESVESKITVPIASETQTHTTESQAPKKDDNMSANAGDALASMLS